MLLCPTSPAKSFRQLFSDGVFFDVLLGTDRGENVPVVYSMEGARVANLQGGFESFRACGEKDTCRAKWCFGLEQKLVRETVTEPASAH